MHVNFTQNIKIKTLVNEMVRFHADRNKWNPCKRSVALRKRLTIMLSERELGLPVVQSKRPNRAGLGDRDPQNPIDSIKWLLACDMSHQGLPGRMTQLLKSASVMSTKQTFIH